MILEVFKGKRRVASVPGRAREGRNAIRWNGKAGSRAAAAGVYKLVLRATSAGQVVSDSATVRVTGGTTTSTPRPGGGGGGVPGGGGSGGGSGGVGEGWPRERARRRGGVRARHTGHRRAPLPARRRARTIRP